MAVPRREGVVVFLVEADLLVDFEEGFNAFLVGGSTLALVLVVVALVDLAVTLGSLATFFTAGFLVASLDPLVVVPLSTVGFLAEGLALVTVVADLDLVVDLVGAFLEVVDLDTFAGLFCSRN